MLQPIISLLKCSFQDRMSVCVCTCVVPTAHLPVTRVQSQGASSVRQPAEVAMLVLTMTVLAYLHTFMQS